jgi:lysyl-tRNA synthetase class 2
MPWAPSASHAALIKRAEILASIRHFFYERHVLEVETPLLGMAGVTDVHIESFITHDQTKHPYYLQTSPEYAMKRLLAAGYGDMYQICKAFRQEEQGRFHQPEFSLLEWYRVGFNHLQLMDEVDALLQTLLGCKAAGKITYTDLFESHLAINPHKATLNDLKKIAQQHNLLSALGEQHDNKDDWLQLLLSHLIEAKLGHTEPCMIYDYPASQAALAKINLQTQRAERFEVYVNGIELANGFHELQDAKEQQQRFLADLQQRQSLQRPTPRIDQQLLQALEHGLPACAGVALGIDRLIQIALEKKDIQHVISFAKVPSHNNKKAN